MPGIFSARYAGENANDRRNVEKLLRELQDARDRSARFYCVIALAKNGQLMTTVAGEVAGTITKSPRGENGFGYDPIFVPNEFSETFAELTSETKNKISHRAQAAAALGRHFNTAPRSGRNVIGIRTRDGEPGLKRQRRKAETVELSKIGLPMLCSIVTPSEAKPAWDPR